MIHAFWISEDNYGVSIDTLRKQRSLNDEYNLRYMKDILDVIVQLDERPLNERRPADKQTVGNCRDFTLFLTSVLRHQDVPARVRSGVARYFYTDGHLEDHFITECWNDKKGNWQYTDPQIDALLSKTCGIVSDVTDLPRNEFIHAGLGYL